MGYLSIARNLIHASPYPNHCAPRQVMFLKTDHAKAIECYRTVLRQKPNNYQALQKLIGLLRRAGQLNEVRMCCDNHVQSMKNG